MIFIDLSCKINAIFRIEPIARVYLYWMRLFSGIFYILLIISVIACSNNNSELKDTELSPRISKDSLTQYSLNIMSSIDSSKWIPIRFDTFDDYSFVTLSTEDTSLMGCHSCVADVTVIGFHWGEKNELLNIDTLIYLPISSVWGHPPNLNLLKLNGQFLLIATEKDGAGGEQKEWLEIVPLTGCNSGEVALSWEAQTGHEQTYFNTNSIPVELKDSLKIYNINPPFTASFNSSLMFEWDKDESLFSIWTSQRSYVIIPPRKSRQSPFEIKLKDMPLRNFVFDGCQWSDRSKKGI